MPALPTDLRNKLERAVINARDVAEAGARAALEAIAVHHHEPYPHQKPDQRKLRNQLRARARQLGDKQDSTGRLAIGHLISECAYEHWHRMLFARFLAENDLLIEPDSGMAVSLDEVKELAKDEKTNLWVLAGRYAQTMLPEIFRADDPVLQVPLAREDQLKLEQVLDALTPATFTASDSLGWCYQFWQARRKEQVNAAGNKIGADELPAVTQLFTEDYMVDFLLDNTLGAWYAGNVLAANPKLVETARTEDEFRLAVALPGCPWRYLRFIQSKGGEWTPAAGTFDGWPKTAKKLKCLDPCMGSGHFVVAMFERLMALRMAEEKLDETAAVAAVIRDNLFGLEIDPRCTQIGAFNLALAAWRRLGHCQLPAMNLACSGLAPNTRESDWLAIAGDNEKLQRGMERLYRLFQQAAVLGSLIDPRAAEGDLLEAAYHELQPLMERALAQEANDDTTHEMAVTARGLAKAAEILASQFALVATNVPYLGRGKQNDVLKEYCDRIFPDSQADLATCFVQRCLSCCAKGGSVALVTPQNWWFIKTYASLRNRLLAECTFRFAATLGEEAWQSFGDRGPVAGLIIITRTPPGEGNSFPGLNPLAKPTIEEKITELLYGRTTALVQVDQLRSPDHRISVFDAAKGSLLSAVARSFQGVKTGDDERACRGFWEIPRIDSKWRPFQSSPSTDRLFGGMELLLFWGDDGAGLARRQGLAAWDNRGVLVSQMRSLSATLYLGDAFAGIVSPLVVQQESYIAAVWAYCSSTDYKDAVRKIDSRVSISNGNLVSVPFDLAHWQKVADEKYPDGLPKPFSSDPTQWLFNGHPKGADQPLHVAVARLLGYLWPRQTGSNFPDSPALGPDELETLADDDGIVCLPSVRGEESAADRLLALLSACGIKLNCSLDEYLHNDFFQEHCELFHQRPFIWHIWDGRKRDGFHALVNYHKLADGKKGKKLLESLTYSYLGEWINRQKDGVKRDEDGAEDRLAAALELQKRLVAILEGEPPFDLFVRWKPLTEQAISWEPDINDGVRMNIRPFLASDIPGGKKGAGVLRWKPNIKWEKDRGKEPERKKAEYPWFWGWDEATEDFLGGKEFKGERFNDCHYTIAVKRAAREAAKKR
jgi:hypothetical protein